MPASRHEPHFGAGLPGAAHALMDSVPTQRDRPPPRSSQQPAQFSGSHSQCGAPPSVTHDAPRPHCGSAPHAQPRPTASHRSDSFSLHCSQAELVRFTAQSGKAEVRLAVAGAHASPWQQVWHDTEQPWQRPVVAPLHIIVDLQPKHVPPRPQAASFCITHAAGPPSSDAQQPWQFEVPSHVQRPSWQTWPAGHAGPPPQVQPVAPEPQPSASGPHAPQSPPDLRQLDTEVGMHWPLRQQPAGHDDALQVHALPLHDCPGLQTGSVPHRQVPPPPQAFATCGPHTLQVPAGPRHR